LWRHFFHLDLLLFQTQPGVLTHNFFLLFTLLVVQAAHELGVPADVGFGELEGAIEVVGTPVGAGVIGWHLRFFQKQPGILWHTFFLFIALRVLQAR
jgi:hypothetical protein